MLPITPEVSVNNVVRTNSNPKRINPKRKSSATHMKTTAKKMKYRLVRNLSFTNTQFEDNVSKVVRRSYTNEDVKIGLKLMVSGMSARKASKHTNLYGNRVPRTTLQELWHQFFGVKANAQFKIDMRQQESMTRQVEHNFELPRYGSQHYFLPDEESLIMTTIELAYERGFPWDVDNVLALATTMLQDLPKHRGKSITKGWLRGFRRRFKDRIALVKTCSLCQARADKATIQVRDECFQRFIAMLDSLRRDGRWTNEHDCNLGNHIANADEIGGNELGFRKKVFAPKQTKTKAKKQKKRWRSVQVGDDHNPFHATTMLLTFGNGVVSNAVGVLHSAPGTSNPKPNREHKTGLHPDWFQATTTNGSMTRKTFEMWCKYLVRYFSQKGRCCKHNPIILMLDGHTSRWTHAGLQHLNDNCIYPFCIASHTSAWCQPNDCGINSIYKKEYGKAKKRWRLQHPFMPFTRSSWNKVQLEALNVLQASIFTFPTYPRVYLVYARNFPIVN